MNGSELGDIWDFDPITGKPMRPARRRCKPKSNMHQESPHPVKHETTETPVKTKLIETLRNHLQHFQYSDTETYHDAKVIDPFVLRYIKWLQQSVDTGTPVWPGDNTENYQSYYDPKKGKSPFIVQHTISGIRTRWPRNPKNSLKDDAEVAAKLQEALAYHVNVWKQLQKKAGADFNLHQTLIDILPSPHSSSPPPRYNSFNLRPQRLSSQSSLSIGILRL